MYKVGSIVIVKDVTYYKKKNLKIHKNQMAVVIAETSENFYFLSMSRFKGKRSYNTMMYENDIIGKYLIYLHSINKKPLSFAKEISKLTDEELKEVLKNLKYYQENIETDSKYNEIFPILSKKIK